MEHNEGTVINLLRGMEKKEIKLEALIKGGHWETQVLISRDMILSREE